MNRTRTSAPARRGPASAGFTLMELMVSLAIGLVVVIGFTTTFLSMKTAFRTQDAMAQLQDNERLAMSILSASIQQAGYYPDAISVGSAALVTTTDTTYGNMSQGQAIFGQDGSSLSTAYASNGASDGLLSCLGQTVGAGAVRNVFYVSTSDNTLHCKATLSATASTSDAIIVQGVSGMSVLYGVLGSGSTTDISSYVSATNVTDWTQIRAVRITLNFVDPGDSTHTIPWTQTVYRMNPV
ncbi:MAG: PilW family protein [Burkholderiaceae bacterium]